MPTKDSAELLEPTVEFDFIGWLEKAGMLLPNDKDDAWEHDAMYVSSQVNLHKLQHAIQAHTAAQVAASLKAEREKNEARDI